MDGSKVDKFMSGFHPNRVEGENWKEFLQLDEEMTFEEACHWMEQELTTKKK